MVPLNDFVRQHADGLTREQIDELTAWAAEHLSQQATAKTENDKLARQIEVQLLLEQVARLRRQAALTGLRTRAPENVPASSEYTLDPKMTMHEPNDSSDSSDTTRMEDTDEHDLGDPSDGNSAAS